MVTIIGVLLGFFIGISFPSVSITKLHFPSSFVSYIEDRNSGLTTQALLNHAWTSARNARENSSEPSSNTTLKIYVPTNPKGAERLAPAIVVPETDFHLRRLWGEPSEVYFLAQHTRIILLPKIFGILESYLCLLFVLTFIKHILLNPFSKVLFYCA